MKLVVYPSIAFFGVLAGIVMTARYMKEKSQACKDRKLREHLSERQIDRMIEDSFPASDPPSTY